MDIKLRKSTIENVLFTMFVVAFLLMIFIIEISVSEYYFTLFITIFSISLMGVFAIGFHWVFQRWSNKSGMNETIVNNKIIIKRICIYQIPLIFYYSFFISLISIIPYRDELLGEALSKAAYSENIAEYTFRLIPICYEIIIFIQVTIYYYTKKRQVQKLEIMLNAISEGNLPNSNPFTVKEQYHNYGEALVNLGIITTKAVSDKLRNEKMKVELITNVSHDLKTPLTSMVGYIELMKKEELSEIMSDYVAGISDKAEKLSEMIQSLFDLAKTASGNADLHLETINMNRLIVQIMADLDTAIKSNDKLIKMSLSEDNADFIADSAFMYRVCQNLIENAIKYSLPGSRIIVATVVHEGNIILTIKNVANYEMNFSENEITERFTRADEARTTNGNGLGLAIAKTYTEACGGRFSVKVDDDVFVAKVEFSVG